MSMQYVAGGTMLAQSGSYVVRDADHILRERLMLGEFCYVLTPRQMGKSSLMVQTAFALRERGIASAILDLSKQGYNLDSSQWYNGLLEMLGDRLGLEDEMEAFCRDAVDASPLQRWHRALRSMVLANIPGPIVIFVDEIDITRRLSFETDEFFAAIRACYNSRAEDPAYRRLTFCLLGVAAPSDLIRDPLLTPFNIGSRIDLHDFTFAEAAILDRGLGRDEETNRRLMERVYFWTNGHPYLTQRLCMAITLDSAIQSPANVDRCCKEIFLNTKVGASDDNLTFVRQRLALQNDDQRAALLTIYQQVLSGRPVIDNDADPYVPDLKLAGAVRSENGLLVPRNRIYHTVFDRHWVTDNMPGAELRRQRAAYRRGVLVTALVSALILLTLIAAVGFALYQSRRVELIERQHARDHEQAQKKRALEVEHDRQEKRTILYGNAIGRAQLAWIYGNYPAVFKSLEDQRSAGTDRDLRGFEWRYLWQQSQQDRSLFLCSEMNVFCIAVSPDGRLIAAGGQAKVGKKNTVRVWETASRRERAVFLYPGEVNSLAFSSDGKMLAAGGGVSYDALQPGSAYLWDLKQPQQRPAILSVPKPGVKSLAFFQGSRDLAVGTARGVVRWKTVEDRNGNHTMLLFGTKELVSVVAISSDGPLAYADDNGVWIARSRRSDPVPRNNAASPSALIFSPDGQTLAIGDTDGKIQLWDVRKSAFTGTFHNLARIASLAFSPNGKVLAAACWDCTLRVWDISTGQSRPPLVNHVRLANSVAFTPEGNRLISGGNDGTVRIWDLDPAPRLARTASPHGPLCGLAISDDGTTVVTTDGIGTLQLWDTHSGHAMGTLREPRTRNRRPLFSPNGNMIASVEWKSFNQRLWHRSREGPYGSIALLLPDVKREAGMFSADIGDSIYRGTRGKYVASIGCLALSPDGDTLALTGRDSAAPEFRDGSLELWSLSRGFLGVVRGAHSNDITALAFTRDGKSVVTGGWDRLVKIWDTSRIIGIQDGRDPTPTIVPMKLERFSAQVFAIAATKDDLTLAVGTKDGKISLCRRITGELLGVLNVDKPGKAITGLAFSADDNLLVSGSSDGELGFWRAAPFERTDSRERISLDELWAH